MNAKLFADTNVLVYAFDRGEPAKQAVAQELLRRQEVDGMQIRNPFANTDTSWPDAV